MAAEASRAPVAVRERTVAPKPIERQRPIINAVPGALDDLSADLERLQALIGSANNDLSDLVSDIPDGGGTVPEHLINPLLRNQGLAAWIVRQLDAPGRCSASGVPIIRRRT